ncbi:lysozyme inhibitor LprI family protein [Pseudomonas sp. NPDC086581]|uniref:lysozyme inhibitor LprI family protein n=1 Tax=Pseudomonas sp. NPDC086581 TaxID=3364432 RepID=UPI00380965D4
MKALLLSLPLLVLSAAALADDFAHAQTQAEINACTGAAYKASDKRLNDLYGQYRQRLDAGQKKALTAAQKAWLNYRDLSCQFETAGAKGGSGYPMAYSNCLKAMTENRIKELQTLSDCQEGDFNCPAPRP